jgi:hypothetical protein
MVSHRAGLELGHYTLATTILLDCTLAFRTLLGISFNPVCSFTVILAFLQP